MKLLRAQDIRGNWSTLLLPIDEADGIDYARLADEIDAIVEADVDGVYSNGTAGEFYAQSEAEFDRVNALLAEKCDRAKLNFQIGASHTSAQAMLDRIKRARSLAPGAFQILLPDWFPPSDAERTAFLERIAEAADPIGLILYNPPHAKRVLTGSEMRTLAERVPMLVGAKVGNVNAEWFESLGLNADRFSVFTPGHMLSRHVPLGSAGAYSNVACLSPRGAQWWYEINVSDPPAASELGERLLKCFDEYITPFITKEQFCNAAVDKLLGAIGNWSAVGTRMRWPYRSIDAQNAERLRPILRERVPELFR